jgi:hypothetical protein
VLVVKKNGCLETFIWSGTLATFKTGFAIGSVLYSRMACLQKTMHASEELHSKQ